MAKWKEFTFHKCDRCGQKSIEPMKIKVSKYVRNDTHDFQFCSQICHDEFYMNRMRDLGL